MRGKDDPAHDLHADQRGQHAAQQHVAEHDDRRADAARSQEHAPPDDVGQLAGQPQSRRLHQTGDAPRVLMVVLLWPSVDI